MSSVELSCVIPAYNEERFIETTLGAIENVAKRQMLPYEIVVVDDGSKDKTFERAMAYAKRNGHVKVVRYSKNMGKGYAVKTGFMRTTGEIIVFADGDLDIDLRTISRYIAALEHGDIVIASKRHPDSHVDSPLPRKLLSHGFNIIVRLLTGAPLKDTQSGLKAMKKSAVLEIFPRLAVKRYAFDVELLAVAHLYGLKVVEMPVNMTLDASFELRDVVKMFVDLLGIAYRLRVIHWYQHQIPTKNSLQNFTSLVLHEQ